MNQKPEIPYYEYVIRMNDIWVNMPKASYEANIYINQVAKQLYIIEKDDNKLNIMLKTSLLKLVSSGVLVDKHQIVLDINRMLELNMITLDQGNK